MAESLRLPPATELAECLAPNPGDVSRLWSGALFIKLLQAVAGISTCFATAAYRLDDGEVIVQKENGVSDFEALKSAIRWRPQRLIFCAFDLLHLNGKELGYQPLVERRAKLK